MKLTDEERKRTMLLTATEKKTLSRSDLEKYCAEVEEVNHYLASTNRLNSERMQKTAQEMADEYKQYDAPRINSIRILETQLKEKVHSRRTFGSALKYFGLMGGVNGIVNTDFPSGVIGGLCYVAGSVLEGDSIHLKHKIRQLYEFKKEDWLL